MVLEITGSKEIDLWFDESVFFPFMNIGFSFATLQALGKAPRETDTLQRTEIGFARMSSPYFKSFLESLSTLAVLELLISCMIFKTCFSVVPTRQKSAVIAKLSCN